MIEQDCAQAIRQQQDAMAQAIVALQYERQPRVWQGYGEPGRAKSVRDAGYHLTFLIEALATRTPALFVEYLRWAKSLFAGLGFDESVLPLTLECTAEVLQESLHPDLYVVALDYLQEGQQHLPDSLSVPNSLIQADAPLSGLARDYLDALLRGDRHAASRMILDAVRRGVSVKEIYLDVFQQAQREVGRLWQTNQISVAHEHYCTAATQLIMSQLYPYIFSTPRKGLRVVVTCVGGELHEIGARMVADFFEMDGWDTWFLGANTPTEGVLGAVQEHRADVLAVSATMTFHLSRVSDLIAALRQTGWGRQVRVLVGGYPFNMDVELWRRVGADGYAPNAQQAVQVAERMLGR